MIEQRIAEISKRYWGEGQGAVSAAHADINSRLAPDVWSYAKVYSYWNGTRKPKPIELRYLAEHFPVGDTYGDWARECLRAITENKGEQPGQQ